MTLYELSSTYERSADLLHDRIQELQQAESATTDAKERRQYHLRIAQLAPMLRETRELAMLCRHYYERNYHKNAKYTL